LKTYVPQAVCGRVTATELRINLLANKIQFTCDTFKRAALALKEIFLLSFPDLRKREKVTYIHCKHLNKIIIDHLLQ